MIHRSELLKRKISISIYVAIRFGASIKADAGASRRPSPVLCLGQSRALMKYANIEYGIEEDGPGRWRWRIYPKPERSQKVIGEKLYSTREEAEIACIQEIKDTLDRKTRP